MSAATISRWSCTTIVDSHAVFKNSKSASIKAHEVQAVATSLQLFNKVDLQTVMKAGRWSIGGTFTFFYLRDLYPQAYSLRKTGPLVAAGIVVSLPACLASFICFSLSFCIVRFGKPCSGGSLKVPRGTLVWISFCLLESHCVYHLGARSNRLSSLFCQILYNPNCHMNYLNYL